MMALLRNQLQAVINAWDLDTLTFRKILMARQVVAKFDEMKMYAEDDPELHRAILSAVQEAAYFNWLKAGSPFDKSLEFWCEAERQVFGFTKDELTRYFHDR